MDIVPSAIPVSVSQNPKAAVTGNTDNISGASGNNRDGSSFTNVLSSAVQASNEQQETEGNTGQKDEPDRPQGLAIDSSRFANFIAAIPVNINFSPPINNEQTGTGVVADLMQNKRVDDSVKPRVSILKSALPGNDLLQQVNQNLAEPASSQEVESVLSQPLSNKTASSTQIGVKAFDDGNMFRTDKISDGTNENKLLIGGKFTTVNKDRGIPLNDSAMVLNGSVNAVVERSPSQLTAATLLKPLETAAGHQQAVLTSNSKPVTDPQAIEQAEPAVVGKVNNQPSDIPVISTVLSTNEQQGKKDNVLVPGGGDNRVEKAADNDMVNKLQLPFQHLLYQMSKNEQPVTLEVTNQTASPIVQDPNNVIGQIVEHASLIKNPGNSEMVIKLKPEHLGDLTLKVAVENGVVSATFHTNSSEVRGIIESSLQQLRQDMNQQGIKVEYVGIYAGLGQPFSNGQGETGRQQTWKQRESKAVTDEFAETLTAIENVNTVSSNSGVDYRV